MLKYFLINFKGTTIKKILTTLISLLTLITTTNAEIFTKNYQKINHTIKTDKPVNLELKFKSPKERCTVAFTVYNEDDVLLISTRHNMQKKKEIFNLSVKKGKYFLQMSTHAGCLNKPFDFEVTKVSGNFEQEINNKTSNTNLLTENQVITGYLQEQENSGQDVDYYKINIAEKSIVNLKFKHEKYDNREYFYVQLFSNEDKKLFETTSMLNKKGITKSLVLDSGEYFVKISTYKHSSKVRGIEYKLSYTLD